MTIRAKTGRAWLSIVGEDPVAAAEMYPALEPSRGTMTPGGMWSIDHMLGLLLVTQGKWEEAVPHFDAALAFCQAAGYRPEYASAACDYSDVLLERDGRDGRAKAMSLLDE